MHWNLLCGSVFQEQAPSCVLVGVLTRERVSLACSGASSLVWTGWGSYQGACFGSVFQEQVPSCVPAFTLLWQNLCRNICIELRLITNTNNGRVSGTTSRVVQYSQTDSNGMGFERLVFHW